MSESTENLVGDASVGIVAEVEQSAQTFDQVLTEFLREHIRDRLLLLRALYAVSLTGMRERAFLVRVSAHACGGYWKDVRPIAIAAECLMSSAYTADDAADRAKIRDKRKTVWRRWGKDQAWLIAEMLHALGQCSLDAAGSREASACMRSAFATVIEGQFRQIARHCDRSVRKAIESAQMRTGSLYRACLAAPAIQAESPLLGALAEFGETFGTAVQLADDIQDFFGSPRVLWKPILGDLLNGQPNIVLSHALSQRNSPQKNQVTKLLGTGVENRPSDVRPLLQAIRELGSLDHACRIVAEHLTRAKAALAGLPDRRPRQLLGAFVEHLSESVANHEAS